MAVFFLIYFLLLALRHEWLGTDTWRYLQHFERISHLDWTELPDYRDSEWGYLALNKLVAVCGGNGRAFLWVSAALSVLPVAVLYATRVESPLLAISLFLVLPVFMMGFSGIRQAIAMALGAWVYLATVRRRWWLALPLALLAYMFHKSGIVLLALYPLYHLRLRPRHLPLLLVVYAGVYAVKERAFSLLVSLLGEDMSDRYGEITETGGVTMLILFVLFLLYAFLLPDERTLDPETRGMRNFLALSVLIQLFSPISTISMRLNYYFILFIPILLSRVSARRGHADAFLTGLIRVGMTVFFLVYYFTRTVRTDSLHIYPYMGCF